MAISADDLNHLLRRTEFVPRSARVTALKTLTTAQAVENILTVTEKPVLPTAVTGVAHGGYPQYETMLHWWVDRMRTAARPIQEKMTAFWFGHFTSAYWDVNYTPAFAAQHRLYRTHALGDFRVLSQKMAIEPAMLVYLDNASNTWVSPNQNFARELMELYLLGVGNYSETDVVSAARAWAGHSINWDTYNYVYREQDHEPVTTTWTLFGVKKHWTGAAMIDHVLTDPKLRLISAKFIARKMFEYFAYVGPDDALVTSLANTFITSKWSIKVLLRTILNHPEFYSTRAKQGLVRTPLDWVVSTLIYANIPTEVAHPGWFMESMGMDPLNPPNVSGWRPNGYWLNSSAFGGRADFANRLRWELRNTGSLGWVATTDVPTAVTKMCARFGFRPTAVTRAAMEKWMTAQRGTEDDWAESINLALLAMLAPETHQA
jgi:uncharacterized protein (DUF1800 family)